MKMKSNKTEKDTNGGWLDSGIDHSCESVKVTVGGVITVDSSPSSSL